MREDAVKAVALGYRILKLKADASQVAERVTAIARAALARNMGLMLGCSGPTSLGIAPAYVLGTLAEHNDLDGPALLQEDRRFGMSYRDGRLHCFEAALWGGGAPEQSDRP